MVKLAKDIAPEHAGFWLLRIKVGDGGCGVPDAQNTEGAVRSALAKYVDGYWADDTASGPAIACKLAIRRAYRVRSARRPASGVALTGVDLGTPVASGAMRWSARARMIGAAA